MIIALDQGTSSSRAIAFDAGGREITSTSSALASSYPQQGWVEQSAEEIWKTQAQCLELVLQAVRPASVKGIGITNQRETVIAWNRRTGEAVAPAIVWQCRRSAEQCQRLRNAGYEGLIRKKTGLVIDPYFSGTKIQWMLEHVPGLRDQVAQGHIVFGTVDSWLIYKLTEGKVVATEPSNASRTMLMSLESCDWDEELLTIFGLSRDNLPEIRASDGDFGRVRVGGQEISLRGVLGDQQAALFGQHCTGENEAKCTFGTGAFLLMNSGARFSEAPTGLLRTVAWKRGASRPCYAVEGSIFIAGSAIKWLRDNLKIIASSAEVEQRAMAVPDNGGVTFIPAFVGLGAPYWDDGARGALLGLTQGTTVNHIARAALEGVAHQVADLLEADEFSALSELRIDGGMAENKLFCQLLSDFTNRVIKAASSKERTAYGAALLVAQSIKDSAADKFMGDERYDSYRPLITTSNRETIRIQWKEAISRIQS